MDDKIQLLQFFVCREFKELGQDGYEANFLHSNIYVPKFPYSNHEMFVVTCWRKDSRFHKEVIEYETDYGKKWRSSHMDIEPVTGSVIFRWHKHQFPKDFVIDRQTTMAIRVILDWKVCFESYLLVEQSP